MQSDDIYFNDCWEGIILVTIQSLVGIYMNAMCVGLFFARFSRAQTRATTVVMSNKAVVREMGGNLYLMMQVCEMRKHQLVEPHVRCYAVRHMPSGSNNGREVSVSRGGVSTDGATSDEIMFQSHNMRLQVRRTLYTIQCSDIFTLRNEKLHTLRPDTVTHTELQCYAAAASGRRARSHAPHVSPVRHRTSHRLVEPPHAALAP
jgi:hypothetical protein